MRPEGDTAARSADYHGRYQQPKRQSLSAAIEEINRPRGLAATVVQLSRDLNSKFKRDNAFRCEGRALKNINKSFLQNEANIAARREMHDKASYQLLSLAEVAVGFALGFALTLI